MDEMPEAPDLTGTTLDGRYRLVRKHSEGGMGHVYEGVHVSLDRKVAVKTLHPRLSYEARFRERFLLEAKSASKIGHANVVDIMDFGETPDGSVYFVMEFLEGRDLRALLAKEGRLSWPRTRRILLQTVDGLEAAHELDIVHRDVKPGNCFLVDPGKKGGPEQIKLLDFGIAKVGADADSSQLTATGEVYGTAAYMAPEQARGEPLDARSDIYALGIMTYEMLTGSVPFSGGNAIHVITQHLTDTPERPRTREPSIPAAVEALVLIAMAKKVGDRFASMTEFREAIERIPANIGTSGRSLTGPRPTVQLDSVPDELGSPEPSGARQRLRTMASSEVSGAGFAPPAIAAPAVMQQAEVTGPNQKAWTTPHAAMAGQSGTGPLSRQTGVPGMVPITQSHPIPIAVQPLSLGQKIALVLTVLVVVAGLSTAATVLWLSYDKPLEDNEPGVLIAGDGEVEVVAEHAGDEEPRVDPEPTVDPEPVIDAEPIVDADLGTDEGSELDPQAVSETTDLPSEEPESAESEPLPADPEPAAKPKRPNHRSEECAERRKKAQSALDRRKWREVLSATSVSSCWSSSQRSSRRGLRVMAYLQLREFTKCVKTGRGVNDPKIKNAVRICEGQRDKG